MVTQKYKLNLVPKYGGMSPIIHISQNDNTLRNVEFTIYSEDTIFEVPSNATATIDGIKPDKKAFTVSAQVSSGKVVFPITSQMAAVSGNVYCQVSLLQNGGVIGTSSFVLRVQESPLDENPDMSESDISAIIDAKNSAIQSAIESAQSANEAAQSAIEASEILQNSVSKDAVFYQKIDNVSDPFVVGSITQNSITLNAMSPQIVTGAFYSADDETMVQDSSQTAICYPLSNSLWFCRLYGKLTASREKYYQHGISIEKIASALGLTNYRHAAQNTSFANTYRVWDYDNSTEKTSLYSLYSTLDSSQTKYLRPNRVYSIANGTAMAGGWEISSLPEHSFIFAEFYMMAW